MIRHLSILVGLIWMVPMAAHADQIISDTIQDGVRTIVGVHADANYQVAMPLSGDGGTLPVCQPSLHRRRELEQHDAQAARPCARLDLCGQQRRL